MRLSPVMVSLVGLSLSGVFAAVLRSLAAGDDAGHLSRLAEDDAGPSATEVNGQAGATAVGAGPSTIGVDGGAGLPVSVEARLLAAAAGAAQVALREAFEVARVATEAALAAQFAVADGLDAAAPSAALVTTLEALDLPAVHDAVLIEAAAAWERVTSLATARQGEVLAELATRREATRLAEFIGDEVGTRLAMTRSVAEAKVYLGVALAEQPAVHAALVAGVIDHRKAAALIRAVEHLDAEAAAVVLAAGLAVAPTLTVPGLQAKMRRVELTVNPTAVLDRHSRDVADRHVRMTLAPGGMAWISAFLPADAAMTVFTAVDALAASADPADPRGMDAKRADALTDLCGRILTDGVTLDGLALRTQQGRRPHLHVVAAATTLLGLDEVPAELAGYGPIPADMARRIADDATWRRIFTDPATHQLTGIGPACYRPGADLTATILARDKTCTFPGCRMPAWKCDLDHRITFDPTKPGQGQTTEENLHSLCEHHHHAKTYGGWNVTYDPDTGDTWWYAPTGHTYRRPRTPFGGDPPDPAQPPDPPASKSPLRAALTSPSMSPSKVTAPGSCDDRDPGEPPF